MRLLVLENTWYMLLWIMGCIFFIRMGITASIFISNPIHTISQCELLITINVPRITVDIIIVRIRGLISMGRI